ncbi:MAG: hypothetical protein ACOVS5_10880 [Oligoflexus sp.]
MICDLCSLTQCGVQVNGGELCIPAMAANDNAKKGKRVIGVPPARILLTKTYYARTAIALANDNRPRRKIADWMADCLYREGIEFRFLCGRIYEIGDEDIDLAFNDPSFRWLSDFIRSAGTLPMQNPHYTMEARLRLIALSFWVDKPEVARHFAR